MTLKDVRVFARIVADWCRDQDDLLGFAIDAHDGGVHVRLEWPHFWTAAREFTVSEVRTMNSDGVEVILGMMADEFHIRTAKFRDPNRLPAP